MMSKKHKKICATLNYVEHFFILTSVFTGCVSISAFASSVGIPVEITISAVGLKICATTAGVKKYKSIVKKNKKKHDGILLLAKTKLNALISKASISSYINQKKTKEEIKSPGTSVWIMLCKYG